LFITINESYEQLVQKIEDSSHLDRDSKDLEDQVRKFETLKQKIMIYESVNSDFFFIY